MPEKNCCYELKYCREDEIERDPNNNHRAIDCPGVSHTTGADGGWDDEGIYIQFCPRKKWLGKAEFSIVYCGFGPDVVVIHDESMFPKSHEHIANIAQTALSDW